MQVKSKVGMGLVGLMILGMTTLPSWAAEPQTQQRAVHYGDLDLSTQAGAETLYERIVTAAQKVCPLPNSDELVRYTAMARCRHQAIEQAVSSIRSPQLTAVFAARNHHSVQTPA